MDWRRLHRRVASVPFLRGIAPYLGLSTVIFAFLIVLGVAIGFKNASASPLPVAPSSASDLEPIELSAMELFVHNSLVSLQAIGGFLTIGVGTVYVLAINGLTLGTVLGEATTAFGPVLTVALLAPHGVFEIPAILLATGLGFRWTHVIWAVASGRQRLFSIPRHVLHTVGWLVITALLLAVGAFVEAELTVPLARMLV
ncbi:stage II sporulation protein M [Halorhabdus sp. CUG00001]|uniref:stage II sporulation protein M n=1 Tax=Halorhabdus sp. CUG00001 TaxID=2600297 RepID=UPI00131A84A2|nr:stage II sporulation protein M [Halorhabdus sp. CUG00001]